MLTSSMFTVVCSFTREYDVIKQKLRMLEDFDKTCLEGAIKGAYHLVLSEWGHQTHTHIILVGIDENFHCCEFILEHFGSYYILCTYIFSCNRHSNLNLR